MSRCVFATRAGFTLFEIVISLLLVSLGVISVIMIYPMGIKTQLLARYQLYAAAKAEEMIESFNASHNANPAIDTEGIAPWDVPSAHKSMAHDLESRIATHRFGLIPLPMDIARRLDSDGDEIRQTLEQGGYLYYSQPMGTSNTEEQGMRLAPPNETQKLVIAITGYAQHNAIGIFPWKAWPYLMPYPSPPLHGLHWPEFVPANVSPMPTFPGYDPASNRGKMLCWEAASPSGTSIPGADVDTLAVFNAHKAYNYDNAPTVELAIAYLQAALHYADQKGMPRSFYEPDPIPNPVPDFEPGTLDPLTGDDLTRSAWKQVQSMRFLAHAATCLTRWKSLAELGGQPSTLGTGLAIGSNAAGSPAINLTHDLIVYYQERCMNLIMRYAASFPYDWGAPRPLQRSQMMDFPLIEFDLFQPPHTGVLFSQNIGRGTIPAAQWKPIPARPIHNIGVSYQFPIATLPYDTATPSQTLPDGSAYGTPQYHRFWGDHGRSTLTKPFKAAERCRQIVFWAVDWQSYEDCETAPSAPVDASKYPIAGPLMNQTFQQRMNTVNFRDEQLYAFRNPEKTLIFMQDVSALSTGSDVSSIIGMNRMNNQWDKGAGMEERKRFSGLYGADRNFNRVLDRGNVPRSVRLRATTVSRFNFYDPRLPLIIR